MLLIVRILLTLILVLLGIVLAAVLLILLVPLRYRAGTYKTGEGFGVHAEVTWLLRLVRVRASLKGKALEASFSAGPLLVKQIPEHTEEEPDHEEKEEKNDAPAAGPEVTGSEPSPAPPAQIAETAGEEETETHGGYAQEGEKEREQRPEEQRPAPAAPDRERPEPREERGEGSGSDEQEPAADQESVHDRLQKLLAGMRKLLQQAAGKVRSLAQAASQMPAKADARLNALAEKLVSFIYETLEKAMNFVFDTLYKLSDDVDSFTDKIETTAEKIMPFADDEARAVYVHVLQRLKILALHYRPRSAEGYMTFGTGAPDLTAMAGGLLYYLLPAGEEGIALTPVWDQAFFEADVTVRGRVRLVHGVTAVIALLIRKNNRRFIMRLLKRGR